MVAVKQAVAPIPPFSNKRPKSLSMVHLVCVALCSAVAGGHIGYHLGVNATATLSPRSVDSCPCDTQRDEQAALVHQVQEITPPCPPVITCNNQHQPQQPIQPVANTASNKDNDTQQAAPQRFPSSMQDFAVGWTRVSRNDFANQFDMGVPLKDSTDGNNQALILYGHANALPTEMQQQRDMPLMASIQNATANCDYLNVVLTNVDYHPRKQCLAIMGQYEAPHVQKWMRLPPTGTKIDSTVPLSFVGRLVEEHGRDHHYLPDPKVTRKHWSVLHKYFETIDSVLQELRPLTEKAAKHNTLVVMFSNFGQSELIVNFCCSARARNLDLSSVLVFATDVETKELVEGLGLTVFYNKLNFGHLPSTAAGFFGDETFVNLMKAKVMCLQMVSMLGYDILFQDSDVVWYRDPLAYFRNKELPEFDVWIADDGNGLPKYLPYRGNGGFFYLRNNRKTMYLLNSMLLLSDANRGNEQYQLNQFLAEQASLYGMRVKVLQKSEFPTGVVYQQKWAIMKGILSGHIHPYVFHMSWTESKTDKLLYFQQMGEWYVENKCVGSNASSILSSSPTAMLITSCCAAKPLITCHLGDRPSVVDCKASHLSLRAKDGDLFW